MAVGGRMQVLMEIIVRNHKVVFANSSIHLAFFQFSHLQLAALTLTNTFPFMAVPSSSGVVVEGSGNPIPSLRA